VSQNHSVAKNATRRQRDHAVDPPALYSFPLGGTIDDAVSANGEPYANLSNAHKFEQTFDASCSCRAPGQSWAEALAAAEAKYGHHPHDTIVTEEQSLRMSRPLQDQNETPAVPQSAQGGATAAAESLSRRTTSTSTASTQDSRRPLPR
jgi:hypothetical protein